jgi:hypothetical protein
MLALAEAETAAILKRLRASGRTLRKKRRAFTPSPAATQALRESGLSERTIEILQEGDRHERAFCSGAEGSARLRAELPESVSRALVQFQEAVTSDVSSPPALALPVGWTERTARQATEHRTYSHPDHGTIHTSPDGKWVRRALVGGLIAGSGTTQESLDAHLKTIGDVGGNPAASGAADANAEALADVVARVRRGGAPVVPEGLHTRLAEALVRGAGREAVPGGQSLHERLRKAATR